MQEMNSFYVADVGCVLELYDFWKSTFPSIQPFYAVKSNSDPVLLSALVSLGTSFDCASKVYLVNTVGISLSQPRV